MMTKKAALASVIDQKVVDYTNEIERIHALELENLKKQHKTAHTALTNQITDLKTQLENLTDQLQTTNLDDKYALTKAKLVRLMKDMGYYD